MLRPEADPYGAGCRQKPRKAGLEREKDDSVKKVGKSV